MTCTEDVETHVTWTGIISYEICIVTLVFAVAHLGPHPLELRFRSVHASTAILKLASCSFQLALQLQCTSKVTKAYYACHSLICKNLYSVIYTSPSFADCHCTVGNHLSLNLVVR